MRSRAMLQHNGNNIVEIKRLLLSFVRKARCLHTYIEYTGCSDCSISVQLLRNSRECSDTLTFQSVYYAGVKPFVQALESWKCAITQLQRTKVLHGCAISVATIVCSFSQQQQHARQTENRNSLTKTACNALTEQLRLKSKNKTKQKENKIQKKAQRTQLSVIVEINNF